MLTAHITRKDEDKYDVDIILDGELKQTYTGLYTRDNAIDIALDHCMDVHQKAPGLEFFDHYIAESNKVEEDDNTEPSFIKALRDSGVEVRKFSSLEEMLDAVAEMEAEHTARFAEPAPEEECPVKECVDTVYAKAIACVQHGDDLIEFMKDMKTDLDLGIEEVLKARKALLKELRALEGKSIQ